MRNILVVILLLLVSSCYIANESSDNLRMIIESKEYDNRVVYYQTRNDSISKYSYVLWNTSGRTMLEINDNVSNPQYFVSQDDTSTVDYMKSFNNGRYFIPTFSEQLLEMKECLRVASKDFDLHGLKCIGCFLTTFDTIAVAVTYDLMDDIRKNNVNFSILDMELSKTCLADSLNNVLYNFNLKVDSIKCQEYIAFYHNGVPCHIPSSISNQSSKFVIDTQLFIELKQKK